MMSALFLFTVETFTVATPKNLQKDPP